MYHVARTSAIESILTHGLTPRVGERSLEFGETEPAVYAFLTIKDCHTALSQWLGDWFTEQEETEGEPISLTVIAFDPTGIAQLPQTVEFEARFFQPIPPEAFRELLSEHELGRRAHASLMADAHAQLAA